MQLPDSEHVRRVPPAALRDKGHSVAGAAPGSDCAGRRRHRSLELPACLRLLYGEWLRDDFRTGGVSERHRNSNVAVLITSARQHTTSLLGPRPGTVRIPV